MSQISAEIYGTLEVSVEGAASTITVQIGTPGPAASVTVGTTTTGAPGSSASVTNSGTTAASVLNFTIPAGATGATGATGPAGPGLPSGGTEGQIIVKNSATDYDTVWQDNFATMLRVNARNETGSTLSKGTVVYISGASGNKPTLSKALATGDATSAQTLGVVTADILTNQNGTVTVRGLLENLDTSAYSAGAQLYLSPTTAGAWTTTKPSAPDHLVYVGIVVRSHANQGSVEVAIQNGFELEELHDVALASEANNDLLAYESATDLWKNKSASTLGLLTSATAASTYLAKASNLSDVASASTARTNLGLGTAATASSSQLVPSGGTTGQVLAKASGTNYDLTWTTASASVAWGGITGTLSNQTDLNTALGLKAPLASPALTGTPTAPTATAGTSTTQIATTAFVTAVDVLKAPLASPTFTGTVTIPAGASISGYLTTATAASTYAPIASPTFTGDPKAPTPATSDNDTSIATTAFVKAQSYLTTSAAASTYQPIGTYLTDAPSDGSYYVRRNGAWEALIIS